MPFVVETRTTMPEQGWRRYPLGNTSRGSLLFVSGFLSYEAPASLHCFGFHQIPTRIRLSPVSLQEKWYNNITFLVRKFSHVCIESLAPPCYTISNRNKETKRKKTQKSAFLPCLPTETTARQELRAWCSCISLASLQGAAHQPCYSNHTKHHSDPISDTIYQVQHAAVTRGDGPTDLLLSRDTTRSSSATCSAIYSTDSR